MKPEKEIVLQEYKKESPASVRAMLADRELVFTVGKEYLVKHTAPSTEEKFFRITAGSDTVGLIRVRRVPAYRAAWIEMLAIARAFRGQGYGEKTLARMLSYLFQTQKVRKVHALIRRDNLPYASLLKKMGASVEGILDAEFSDSGEPVDGLLFSFKNPQD